MDETGAALGKSIASAHKEPPDAAWSQTTGSPLCYVQTATVLAKRLKADTVAPTDRDWASIPNCPGAAKEPCG